MMFCLNNDRTKEPAISKKGIGILSFFFPTRFLAVRSLITKIIRKRTNIPGTIKWARLRPNCEVVSLKNVGDKIYFPVWATGLLWSVPWWKIVTQAVLPFRTGNATRSKYREAFAEPPYGYRFHTYFVILFYHYCEYVFGFCCRFILPYAIL